MDYGTKFCDGGNLILSPKEKESLLTSNPEAEKFIRPLVGSEEFIRGKQRFCLWIKDDELEEARAIPLINERIEKVRINRSESTKAQTREESNIPWKATEIRFLDDVSAIIVPCVSSEKRLYIPIGYLEKDTVVTNRAFVIYDAPLWLFAILVSKMHMVWTATTCGRLGTGFNYSNTLCYNTFPFPSLTDAQKQALESTATSIIDIREEHYDMTMAQLYNPDTMPDDLKAAHESNDLLVDRLFRKTGFDSDEDRLAELFRLYEANTKGDN